MRAETAKLESSVSGRLEERARREERTRQEVGTNSFMDRGRARVKAMRGAGVVRGVLFIYLFSYYFFLFIYLFSSLF